MVFCRKKHYNPPYLPIAQGDTNGTRIHAPTA